MKTLLILLFPLLFVSCASKGPKTQRINSELSFQEIAHDTFVVTDETFYMSNVLVAKMMDGTVIIASSPFDTVGAEALIQWINKTLEPKKIIAINTHFHGDGTGGNAGFKNHGVEIWSSHLTRDLYLRTADANRYDVAKRFTGELSKRIESRAIVPADKIFKARDGLLLNFGGENVEVIYPGPAHTMDNMVVYIPTRRVLFGGCMIRPTDQIGPLGDADIDQWENSVETLLPLNAQFVIPGHGPVGGPEQLENTLKVVRETRQAEFDAK